MRPTTLSQVAELAASGEPFDRCLANFLDEFKRAPAPEAVAEAPVLLAGEHGWSGQVQDAYIAATAEYLAQEHHFSIPNWTRAEERRLHRPWFASPLASLRTVLLLESPAAFRSRNLFVSENALFRV
jgi:hypothetical protein